MRLSETSKHRAKLRRAHFYPLVEMRVHDISVVADLNRHDPNAQHPNEPVAFDGTLNGKADEATAEVALDNSWAYCQCD